LTCRRRHQQHNCRSARGRVLLRGFLYCFRQQLALVF
jgi:hypothetical protein